MARKLASLRDSKAATSKASDLQVAREQMVTEGSEMLTPPPPKLRQKAILVGSKIYCILEVNHHHLGSTRPQAE